MRILNGLICGATKLNNPFNIQKSILASTKKFALWTRLSSSAKYVASKPAKESNSWERSARLVKNTTVQNQYLEHIRKLHEPEMQIKTLEDEIKGTMGKALGKQANKIQFYINLMEEQLQNYNRWENRLNSSISQDKQECQGQMQQAARSYNQFRKHAIQARWELMVHRQAVGFVIGNQTLVYEKFPIGERLPEHEFTIKENNATNPADDNNEIKSKKQFGDQLDWWQRIGRWK